MKWVNVLNAVVNLFDINNKDIRITPTDFLFIITIIIIIFIFNSHNNKFRFSLVKFTISFYINWLSESTLK